jgi:hypothetical protein
MYVCFSVSRPVDLRGNVLPVLFIPSQRLEVPVCKGSDKVEKLPAANVKATDETMMGHLVIPARQSLRHG